MARSLYQIREVIRDWYLSLSDEDETNSPASSPSHAFGGLYRTAAAGMLSVALAVGSGGCRTTKIQGYVTVFDRGGNMIYTNPYDGESVCGRHFFTYRDSEIVVPQGGTVSCSKQRPKHYVIVRGPDGKCGVRKLFRLPSLSLIPIVLTSG